MEEKDELYQVRLNIARVLGELGNWQRRVKIFQ